MDVPGEMRRQSREYLAGADRPREFYALAGNEKEGGIP